MTLRSQLLTGTLLLVSSRHHMLRLGVLPWQQLSARQLLMDSGPSAYDPPLPIESLVGLSDKFPVNYPLMPRNTLISTSPILAQAQLCFAYFKQIINVPNCGRSAFRGIVVAPPPDNVRYSRLALLPQ